MGILVLLGALTACAPPVTDDPPTTPTVTPSAVEPPSDEELLEEATTVVIGAFQSLEDMRAQRENDPALLTEYMYPEYAQDQTDLLQWAYDEGSYVLGAPQVLNVILNLTVSSTVDSISAVACVDASQVRLFDANDVDITIPDPVLVLPFAFTAVRDAAGALRVFDSYSWDAAMGDPCT